MAVDVFGLLILLALLALGWRLANPGRGLRRLQHELQPAAGATGAAAGAPGGLIRSERLSSIPLLQHWLLRWRRTLPLQHWLEQAGVSMRPGKFLIITAGAAALAGLLAFGLVADFTTLPAALAGAWIPWAWVARLRQRRLTAFQNHLPDALDLFVRASRAGHPPAAILELIATEMPEPLAGQFRQVWEEQRFGLPLRECWMHLCDRIPLVDVRFLATTMIVQRESGGSLAEILDKLAAVMRERVKVKREVRTHTAQARMTMWMLAALAPLLLLLMDVINAPLTQPMFSDPLGRMLLGVGAALQVLGILLLQRIMKIAV
ncbi:MAG: type II secretion system F family protein [Terriglobales bacterium]